MQKSAVGNFGALFGGGNLFSARAHGSVPSHYKLRILETLIRSGLFFVLFIVYPLSLNLDLKLDEKFVKMKKV